MIPNQLQKLIKKLPSGPGVYFFKDKKGKNIYIGKAANLKARVLNYLKTEDQRIQKMVQLAKGLKHMQTGSDIEALILESQYIKKHRPMFNVVMRDDKQYFYVGFTKEKFPRIFLTHQPTSKKDFVGPFTDGSAIKTTLRYLRNIFPYCTCKQLHNNYCLNYHIGKCLGYCCLKHHETLNMKHETKIYKKNINAIKDVLSGKKQSLMKKLEREMTLQAKNDNFENAIKIRTKLERLKRIFENARFIKELQGREETLIKIKDLLGLETLPQRIEAYDISNIQGQNATGSMIVFENGQPNKNEYRKFKIRNISTCDVERKTSQVGGDTGMLREVLTRRFNHPEWQFPDLIIIDGGKGQLSAAKSIVRGRTSADLRSDLSQIPIIALTKNFSHKGEKLTLANNRSLSLSTLPEDVRNLILAIDSEAHRFAISYYRKLHRKIYSKG